MGILREHICEFFMKQFLDNFSEEMQTFYFVCFYRSQNDSQ